jgi:hypothetical protein
MESEIEGAHPEVICHEAGTSMSAASHWLAWAAGFFDGEGCIILRKQVNKRLGWCSYVLSISVSNTDLRSLQKLEELFGSSVHRRAPMVRRKPIWDWRLDALKGERCLRLLLPWLVVKHEQAELALLSRKYISRRRGAWKSQKDLDNLEWLKRRLSDLKKVPSVEPEVPAKSEELQLSFAKKMGLP